MASDNTALPEIVSEAEWRAAAAALLAKEKELTRARDALAAERRRLPMFKIDPPYVFAGPQGPVTLADLFQGRSQLLLYHFMFAPGVHGWPAAGCPGCSMFLDNIGQYTRTHLKAKDVSFAVVARAPFENIEAYRTRMQWDVPWVSSADNTFNTDLGLTVPGEERHGLSVFVRRGEDIFRTYFTTQRGLETVGTIWSLLDITPWGRQESWEDSPQGWPQAAPYQWWRRHDEY